MPSQQGMFRDAETVTMRRFLRNLSEENVHPIVPVQIKRDGVVLETIVFKTFTYLKGGHFGAIADLVLNRGVGIVILRDPKDSKHADVVKELKEAHGDKVQVICAGSLVTPLNERCKKGKERLRRAIHAVAAPPQEIF